MHHFRVLLREGTNATREGIQQCLDQLDLEPDGYQVGKTMVRTLPLSFSCCIKVVETAVFVVTLCHFKNLLFIQKILNNLLVNAEQFGTFCSSYLCSALKSFKASHESV